MTNLITGSAERKAYSDTPAGWIAEFEESPNARRLKLLDALQYRIANYPTDTAKQAGNAAALLRDLIFSESDIVDQASELLLEAANWATKRTDDGLVLDEKAALRYFLDSLEELVDEAPARAKGRPTTGQNQWAVRIFHSVFKPRGFTARDALPHICKYLVGAGAPAADRKQIERRVREHFRHLKILD